MKTLILSLFLALVVAACENPFGESQPVTIRPSITITEFSVNDTIDMIVVYRINPDGETFIVCDSDTIKVQRMFAANTYTGNAPQQFQLRKIVLLSPYLEKYF